MAIVCMDNAPIMLQSLREHAEKAHPCADVQAFLTAESTEMEQHLSKNTVKDIALVTFTI